MARGEVGRAPAGAGGAGAGGGLTGTGRRPSGRRGRAAASAGCASVLLVLVLVPAALLLLAAPAVRGAVGDPGELEKLEAAAARAAELSPEVRCKYCKVTMEELVINLRVDDASRDKAGDETRRTAGEIGGYLNNACDMMTTWYEADVVDVCRTILPSQYLAISGLMELGPSNLNNVICSMVMGYCDPSMKAEDVECKAEDVRKRADPAPGSEF